ncbi:MAG: PAS domain S-box protein [Candidatus Bathyarchaeota archaeon]|nr:PAS domain S-box protein [Candidatus Bathyarchaeota archaeon]
MSKKKRGIEAKARVVLNFLTDMAVIVDEKGFVLLVNNAFEEVTGLNQKEVTGKQFLQFEILPPESKNALWENLEKRMRGLPVEPYEVCFTDKAGKSRWVEVKGRRVNYGGRPADLVVFHDITQRKEDQQLLKEYAERMEALVKDKVKEITERERQLRSIFENSMDGVMLTKPDGSILAANPQACQMLGMTEEEIKKAGRDGIVVKDEKLTAALKERDATGRVKTELTFKRKDGSTFLGEISSALFADSDGTIKGSLMIRDVTERKKIQDAIMQERDTLGKITANIGAGLAIIDKNYTILWANDFLKYYRGNIEGKLCYTVLNSLNEPCPDCGVTKIFARKTSIDSHEYCSRTINGEQYWVQIIATPIKDENGNVTSVAELAVDITAQKQMQRQLQESEEKFHSISESARDAIFMFHEDDTITYWNPAATRIFGFTEKEALGKKVHDLVVPPRFAEDHLKLMKKIACDSAKKHSDLFEFPALRKGGEEFPIEISMATLELNGKRHIVAIARDITERKKLELALKSSELKYRKQFEESFDAIFLADAETGIILDCNPAAARLVGREKSELIGSHQRILHPPERIKGEFSETFQLHAYGENMRNVEEQVITKNGEIKDVVINAAIVDVEGRRILLGTFRDVTEQKALLRKLEEYSEGLEFTVEARTQELREAHRKLLKAERLAAIGELAGMVGHDLRNPLTSIRNAAYYVNKKLPSCTDENIKHMLKIIDNSILRADKIINDLLEYSREMWLDPEECTPKSLLKEALSQVQVPTSVTIADKTQRKPLFMADKNKMERVFINMIKNAVDAMPCGGTLQIRSAERDGNVEITFTDTGVGIPNDILGKLFAPLVTTKAQGMGFGLAICKRLMEAHGGEITVKSTVGKGTTFTITLPLKPKLEKEEK